MSNRVIRPNFAGMALGFARARLGPLVGAKVVSIELVDGVNGPTPALLFETPAGLTAALVAQSDEEGNDDGQLVIVGPWKA